jgi:hypothetical protein
MQPTEHAMLGAMAHRVEGGQQSLTHRATPAMTIRLAPSAWAALEARAWAALLKAGARLG